MLKVGIIGLGVGYQHLLAFHQHSESQVVAACDVSIEKQRWFKERHPEIQILQRADEIFEHPDIQAVVIASYDSDHASYVLKALACEKHVFVEKPLCLSRQEADQIYTSLQKKPHVCLSTNFILRKYPRFHFLKEKVRNGSLGDLFYMEGDYDYGRLEKLTQGWRGALTFYSVVLGGAIHLIDLLLWLSQGEIEEVMAYGNQIASKGSQFNHSDFVVSLLKFRNGLIGKVSANFGCVRPHFHGLKVYGTQATYEHDLDFSKFFTSRDPQVYFEKIEHPYPGVEKGAFISDFVDAIFHRPNGAVTAREIFSVMAVCFAIEQSIEERKPIKVNYFGGSA